MTKLASRLRCSLVLFATGCAAVPPNRPSNYVRDVIAVDAAHDDDDLSFWDVPYREKAFIDFDPAERNDGLLVGELGVDGGKREVIAELAAEIARGQHGSYDSLLIADRSRLLFESYYLRGRINMTHPQVSVTKAYTALTVGRAIQLGLLTIADLKRPLISFLGELDPKRLVRGAEKITLHQAMTMRSGIRIDTKQGPEFQRKPNELKGQGLAQAYLESSAPITIDRQIFRYQSIDPNLVMQVINAIAPGSADEFIKTELFDKLGITAYSWQHDLSGLPNCAFRPS